MMKLCGYSTPGFSEFVFSHTLGRKQLQPITKDDQPLIGVKSGYLI